MNEDVLEDVRTFRRKLDRERVSFGNRHQEIVDVGAELFSELGYQSAPLQGIADKLGMLKGSLYYYIDTKEDILYAIVLKAHDAALEQARLTLSEEIQGEESLRVFIWRHLGLIQDHRVHLAVYLNDFGHLAERRRRLILEGRGLYERALRESIQSGINAGDFDPTTDVEVAALAILGMMNWLTKSLQLLDRYGVERVVAGFTSLTLQGLRGGASLASSP